MNDQSIFVVLLLLALIVGLLVSCVIRRLDEREAIRRAERTLRESRERLRRAALGEIQPDWKRHNASMDEAIATLVALTAESKAERNHE